MDEPTLEALAVLAWMCEKEKCRDIYRRKTLISCTPDQIPYWLGPLTDNMQVPMWDKCLALATKIYYQQEKQHENVPKSTKEN